MDPTIPWFSHRCSPIMSRKIELIPHVSQRHSEMIHQLIAVMRGRRNTQSFMASRHGRIVDRLYVDAVLPQQKLGDRLAFLGIADMHRHDVGFARHDRQARGAKRRLQPHRPVRLHQRLQPYQRHRDRLSRSRGKLISRQPKNNLKRTGPNLSFVAAVKTAPPSNPLQIGRRIAGGGHRHRAIYEIGGGGFFGVGARIAGVCLR